MNKKQPEVKLLSSRSGRIRTIIITIFLLLQSIPAYSQNESAKTYDDFYKMSLEELMITKITTAGKQAQKISDIPASVVVITRKEIENYGYCTLEEILESIPGFYQVDDWQTSGTNFGVRGFLNTDALNRNIAFMVNGLSQTADFQGGTELMSVNLPVESICRIEVVRGPMSVIYGTGALFGVINIITNEHMNDTEQSSLIAGSYGSFETHRLAFRSTGQKDDIGYALSVSSSEKSGVDEPYSELNENLSDTAATSSTEWMLEEQRRSFSFSGNFKDIYGQITYDDGYNRRPKLLAPLSEDKPRYDVNAVRLGFGFKNELSPGVTIDTRLNYFNLFWEVERNYIKNLYPHAMETSHLRANSWEAEIDVFLTMIPNLDILLGLNYYSTEDLQYPVDAPVFGFNNVLIDSAGDPITTRAIFTEATWQANSKMLFVVGVRLEQQLKYQLDAHYNRGFEHIDPENFPYELKSQTYDEEDVEAIPRFAAIFSPNKRNVFKLLYGEAINRPSFFMNLDDVLVDDSPELNPEEIQTLELNYTALPVDDVSTSLSVFMNNLDNLIERFQGYVEGAYITRMTNFGQITTRGVEFQIQTRHFNPLWIDLAITYQDTEDRENRDIDVAFAPKVLGYLKVSYPVSDQITISLTANYVDEMEAQWNKALTDPDDPNSGAVGRVGDKVDSYVKVGANIRIKNLIKEGLFINIRVNNLLDEEIRYPISSNQGWATKGTIAEGLGIFATVGYEF